MFFSRPSYTPLNSIEILSQNILENIAYLQSLQPSAAFFPCVKSNAYGHGLKEVCQILEKTSVSMLTVDSFPEAQMVYKHSKKKVFILGEMAEDAYQYCNFKRTEFCVFTIDTLKILASFKKNIAVHLFVNTGMNREGIQNLEVFLREAKEFLPYVQITGLCSHFASADDDSELNTFQEERFFDGLEILNKHGIFPKWIHLGNSAGIFILTDGRFTAFRPGIACYGYNVFPKDHPQFEKGEKLKPSLRFLSRITTIQKVDVGDKISYNETYEISKPSTIGVIPVGYFEGLDRRLSNKAVFSLIRDGKKYDLPVAGRVCMNFSCLDAGDLEIQKGDIVEVISEDKGAQNSVISLAQIEGSIQYELLVKLQVSIRRVIV